MSVVYFKLFGTIEDVVESLSDEQRGRLFMAILRMINGEAVELEGVEKGIFLMLQSQFERDKAEYDLVCTQNRENGKKGGRPRKDKA